MKIIDLLREGGWDTTATQGTIINPALVKSALIVAQQFVVDFNNYLKPKGLGPVAMGRPTGSSAYHEKDQAENPTKIYGDIDLQMIAPPVENTTYGQFTALWTTLADEFVKASNPSYLHPTESKPGHPIIKVGADQYVQVDLMWHEEKMRDWGATRVTPEHGVKGLLSGNMYSVLGELLDMSIQHAGVQLKVVDNSRVPFSKQKGTQTLTITINPKTFIYDIFKYEYQQITGKNFEKSVPVDSLLTQYPGNDIDDVRISKLANGVKGLARSFEMNNMYGDGSLANYSNANEFISRFVSRYEEKAMDDVNNPKRNKASTPAAIERAEDDKKKVLDGLAMVKGYFK
jgi:hypothetical protein